MIERISILHACLDPDYHSEEVCSQIHSPWLGDTVDSAHVAWLAGTTTLCQSLLYPLSQGLWIWLLDPDQHSVKNINPVECGAAGFYHLKRRIKAPLLM